jgi:hypothetical protein
MALKAVETILSPFGWDVERLGETLAGRSHPRRKRKAENMPAVAP